MIPIDSRQVADNVREDELAQRLVGNAEETEEHGQQHGGRHTLAIPEENEGLDHGTTELRAEVLHERQTNASKTARHAKLLCYMRDLRPSQGCQSF